MWDDETVDAEEKIMSPHLEQNKTKTIDEHILTIFGLNADRVESIFILFFFFSLLLLIFHFINIVPIPYVLFQMPNITINQNTTNTLLQFFEVVGVLGATYFSAKSAAISKAAIDEMKKQGEPHVIVFLRQQPGNLHTVDIVVKNEGRSSAKNIKFTISEKLKVLGERDISDISFFKNGISYYLKLKK